MNVFKVDSKKCEACGTCLKKCPEDAIRIVGIWFHKHAKIAKSVCTDCGICVKICPQNAIINY